MSDEETIEPTNAQLARFLIVTASDIPGGENLRLSAPVLESLMSLNPRFRDAALARHRRFQDQIREMTVKTATGQLPCQHKRPNGKMCPNFNQPGTLFCGLHQEDDDDNNGSEVAQ